jgi:integrase
MRAKLNNNLAKTLIAKNQPYEVVDTDIKGFLLRVQPSGVMTYYYSYRDTEGTRKRYRIGNHGNITPAQARDRALALSAQVITGVDIQSEKKLKRLQGKENKRCTLSYFLDNKYGPLILTKHKSGLATVKRIKSNFREYLEFPLKNINTWLIEKWRIEQLIQNKTASTVNRDVIALRALLSKSVEWGELEEHPLKTLKPLKTDNSGKVRYLTPEEEIRLREALITREATIREKRNSGNSWRQKRGYSLFPPHEDDKFVNYLRPMVLLSLNTGLRKGELFSIRWENISFANKNLTIEGYFAKNGKTRHIPLNSEAIDVLKIWHDQRQGEDYVFSSKHGKQMTNIKRSWKKVLSLANIKNFRWHDLRHHFASKLVMAGVDLNTVRELLGHADITTTLRYAHLAPEHKAQAVERLVTTT